MDLGGRQVRAVRVVALAWLVLILAAGTARAAFPGTNGLLVVQPATGSGLLLVGEDGVNPQRICSAGTRCAGARDPVWSPDGSEIAVSARHRSVFGRVSFTSVIYPDGSCFACSVPGAFDNYGLLPDGRVVVSTNPGVAALTLQPSSVLAAEAAVPLGGHAHLEPRGTPESAQLN